MGGAYIERYNKAPVNTWLGIGLHNNSKEACICFPFDMLVKLYDSQVIYEFIFEDSVWVVDDRIVR